jgi:hypothetical protein
MSTIGDIAAVITAVAVSAAAVGGYIQFVLVRAKVAAQFDVEFASLGSASGQQVGDVSCIVTNLGSNLLVVTRVVFRGRYSVEGDANQNPSHNMEPVLSRQLKIGERGDAAWITLFPPPLKPGEPPARSVVFPGGTQAYRKPLTLPPEARILSLWAACDYHVQAGRFTHMLVKLVLRPRRDLDFTMGLSNHQVRRTFTLVPPHGLYKSRQTRRNRLVNGLHVQVYSIRGKSHYWVPTTALKFPELCPISGDSTL